jgi:hypothetical protein
LYLLRLLLERVIGFEPTTLCLAKTGRRVLRQQLQVLLPAPMHGWSIVGAGERRDQATVSFQTLWRLDGQTARNAGQWAIA